MPPRPTATRVVGDPPGVLLRAALLPCDVPEVLPRVLHATRQDVPGVEPGLWVRAAGRVPEADAPRQVQVVLGVPVPPRPLLAARAAETGDEGEAAAWGAPSGPPTGHRHVTVVHVVGQGPMGALDQDAEADAAFAVGPILHDARRVAEAVPGAAPDLPSRVRVGVRVEGPPVLDDVVAAQGQPDTVLVGAVLVGLRPPDLAPLAAAAIADRREATPASGDTAVGPLAQEAAAWALLDAKVGVAVLQLPRAVVGQVVAARVAATAADHPPVLVPRRPGGVANRAVANLGPDAARAAGGLEGDVAGPQGHGPPTRPHTARVPARPLPVRQATSGGAMPRRPQAPGVDLRAARVAARRAEAGLPAAAPTSTTGRGAGLPIRRQVADVAAANGPGDRPLPIFPSAVRRRVDGPVDQGGTAPAGEGHRPETAIEGARVHLTRRVPAAPTPATLRPSEVTGEAPRPGVPGPNAPSPVSAHGVAGVTVHRTPVTPIARHRVRGAAGAGGPRHPAHPPGLPGGLIHLLVVSR